MTEAEKHLTEHLAGLAKRAADLIERECAVEDGRDHHVALMLLAAGNTVLCGLSHPDSVRATQSILPTLCKMVHAEALRRQNEHDPTKN